VERLDVVVVGGGLAGWAAAANAAGSGRRVHVLDPTGSGGRAATDEQHGFLLNRGAHALYERGPGMAVLERLGIRPPGGPPPLKGGLARRGDQVGLLPSSAGSIARTPMLTVRERARVARLFASMGRWRPATLAGSTVEEWFDQLGLDGGAREVAGLFIRLSTYAADHDLLSADVAAGQLQLAAKGVRYLDGGWVRLIEGLRAVAMERGATTAKAKVTEIVPGAVRAAVRVGTSDGDLEAGAVVLAAGTPDACGALLPEAPGSWTGLGPPSYASCLDVGLDHVPALTSLLGMDQPLYASRHAPAAALAPAGSSVVHAMQYLRTDEHLDPGACRSVLEAHLRLGGVDVERAVVARYLHRMMTVSSLPTPERGGLAGRPAIDSTGLDDVFVAGDWVGPTGYLADGSLASGEAAGSRAAAHVETRAAVH
jgi:phytoene dehydrogenase-like protein